MACCPIVEILIFINIQSKASVDVALIIAGGRDSADVESDAVHFLIRLKCNTWFNL